MAVLLGWVTCVAVLACLLHPATSDHKKKIIVKVPHIIKHIHHDVYKPVHVHKVHAKKVEHHHHEEIEEKKPKWKPKRGHGGSHKAHGSYSHLQPVLLHQEHAHSEEHQQRVDHRPGQEHGGRHDYGREGYWSSENDSGERRARPSVGDSSGERPKWEPINLGHWFGEGKSKDDGDEWLISSEDLRELREDYGILGGKGGSNHGHKRNKDSAKFYKKPTDVNVDKEGWRPLMDFSGWKDVDELHQKGQRGYKREPIDYSGEDDYEGSIEDGYREGRESPEDIYNDRVKSRKNLKKRGKWSKQIEVHEPQSEEDPQIAQRPHAYQPSSQVSPVQRPAVQPQQRRKPYSIPESPQKKWPEHVATPQAQKWPHPQPLSSQPPTPPSSVVWSGHHLQTPQHTMWHVQQHNVQTPVQVPVSSKVPPPLPVLRHLQPQQSQEASVPAHRVTAPAPAPAWPSVQRTPGVTQWEQTVHMGDGDGPGSSYKVEVINYNKQ